RSRSEVTRHKVRSPSGVCADRLTRSVPSGPAAQLSFRTVPWAFHPPPFIPGLSVSGPPQANPQPEEHHGIRPERGAREGARTDPLALSQQDGCVHPGPPSLDRKSTRLNS